MKTFLLLLTGGILIGTASCKTDPEVPASPEVSFQTQVQVILSANCNMSGCHAANGGEFPLTTYEQVMQQVTAGDARNSELYKAVTGRGAERMPPDGLEPLTDEQITTLYVWIQQGAKNN
jgi:uncharacterized membrane protein